MISAASASSSGICVPVPRAFPTGSRRALMGYQWRMRSIALHACGCFSAPAFADAPRRIVSFNLCADQLVVALADPEQIAGLSPYAADPRAVGCGRARRAPSAARLAGGIDHRAAARSGADRRRDRPVTQRMLPRRACGWTRSADRRPRHRARADPRDRGAARPSGARRNADRRDRCGARAAHAAPSRRSRRRCWSIAAATRRVNAASPRP